MAHDQTQDRRPTAGRALTRPGRLRKGPSAAVIIAVAGIVAWGPGSRSAVTGADAATIRARPRHGQPVSGATTARSAKMNVSTLRRGKPGYGGDRELRGAGSGRIGSAARLPVDAAHARGGQPERNPQPRTDPLRSRVGWPLVTWRAR
jgi:hypothetical protein